MRCPAVLRVGRRELGLLVLYGVTGIAMVQWLYFVAIQQMPIGLVSAVGGGAALACYYLMVEHGQRERDPISLMGRWLAGWSPRWVASFARSSGAGSSGAGCSGRLFEGWLRLWEDGHHGLAC